MTVVSATDVQWEKLNPARGDKSPQAATLWGDRNGATATGFLVKFVDGFSSPPHIHNVSYRGVVINGLIHNDDPHASKMWMPKGSYWTQPKGEVHITAAAGANNIAYIEIDEGPYLVRPPADAFDSGERPINVDSSNLAWLDVVGVPQVKVTYLWGTPKEGQRHGSLLMLPAGFSGVIHSPASTFRVIAIQGEYKLQSSNNTMKPGSYFSSVKESRHTILCHIAENCIFYVHSTSMYSVSEG